MTENDLAEARARAIHLRIIVGEIALLDARELDDEAGNLFELDATLGDTKAVVREILRKLPN